MSYKSFIRQHGHPPFRPSLLQRLRLSRRAQTQSKPAPAALVAFLTRIKNTWRDRHIPF